MNAEQRQALMDKVSEIVGEHCKAFIFVATVEDEDGDDRAITQYDGGRAHALGLARVFQVRYESEIAREEARRAEEDDNE